MSGLTPNTPVPTGVVVHSRSRVLELQYANGETYRLPFELLRVYSPSAEVMGHGPGQETLQTGKREVTIKMIEGVGNYAIQPSPGRFDFVRFHTSTNGSAAAPADSRIRPEKRTLAKYSVARSSTPSNSAFSCTTSV